MEFLTRRGAPGRRGSRDGPRPRPVRGATAFRPAARRRRAPPHPGRNAPAVSSGRPRRRRTIPPARRKSEMPPVFVRESRGKGLPAGIPSKPASGDLVPGAGIPLSAGRVISRPVRPGGSRGRPQVWPRVRRRPVASVPRAYGSRSAARRAAVPTRCGGIAARAAESARSRDRTGSPEAFGGTRLCAGSPDAQAHEANVRIAVGMCALTHSKSGQFIRLSRGGLQAR